MQCREAQLILSAMADHEPVGADELAEVREHCRRCTECAAFAKAIATLRKAKPQRVPRGLAPRIVAAVAEEMAAARSAQEPEAEPEGVTEPGAEAAATPLPAAPAAPPTTGKAELSLAWLSRERLWTIIAAVGTSAAVVLLGLMVSGQLTGRAVIEQEAKEAVSRSLAEQGDSGQPAGAQTGGAGAAPVSTPASKAPPFVAFNGRVYAPSPSAEEVNASHLTTVGTVYTALAGGGAPESLNAYTRPSDTSLVIRKTDGTYQVCVPVVRNFGEGVYQLTTGVEIPRYGVWPRLPSDIPEPIGASGSPVFIGAGSDTLGVRIYARIGFDTSGGIAVAPGTTGTDPAGGDPYWTWWARVP